MKKLMFILLSAITFNVYGNNSSPVCDTLSSQDMDSLQMVVSELQRRYEKLGLLQGVVSQQAQEIVALRDSNQQLMATATALSMKVDTLKSLSEKQDCAIQDTNRATESRFSRFQREEKLFIVAIVVIFILVGLVSYILFRKTKKDGVAFQQLYIGYERLSTTCSTLQNDTAKLDGMLLQLINFQTNNNFDAEAKRERHELVLKVADEIVRIEANLSHMSTSVKGYKQLAKAVERIKANFRANGYEIVDMLGKPYHEGMKVTANFVADETLAEGEQLITGVIKPQINYGGEMIQAAQITVSQNI